MVDTNVKKVDKYSFHLNDILGSGTFGNVYKGKDDKTDKQVAIKIISKQLIQNDEYLMQGLQQEVQVMSKLKSQFIVQLYGVLETKNNYYIIQEHCDGGDLRGYLKKKKTLNESESLQILQDILGGFIELLQHGIIHRDLKPENILINQGRYKLADFGFAKTVDNYNKQLLVSLVGTPLYMAPQILKHERYTTKSDIWSMGLIYYELLIGRTPWPAQSQYQLITKIYSEPVKYPPQYSVSQNSQDFINKCLQISEDERISWRDIFKHPLFGTFFSNQVQNNQELENKALFIMSELRSKIHSENIDLTELFVHYAGQNDQMEYKQFQQMMAAIDNQMLKIEVDYIFNKFDTDGDQRINFTEFSMWMEQQNIRMSKIVGQAGRGQGNNKATSEVVSESYLIITKFVYAIKKFNINIDILFKNFDQKTNFLKLEQFEKMLLLIDKSFQKEEIRVAFQKFDIDKDQKITLQEFKQTIQEYEQLNPELMAKLTIN